MVMGRLLGGATRTATTAAASAGGVGGRPLPVPGAGRPARPAATWPPADRRGPPTSGPPCTSGGGVPMNDVPPPLPPLPPVEADQYGELVAAACPPPVGTTRKPSAAASDPLEWWSTPEAAYRPSDGLAVALASLSPEQLTPARLEPGAALITAGPGSGKTRVLACRIGVLVNEHGARPWEITAVTFTNRAAAELAERVAGLLGADRPVRCSTFHSLCVTLLRRSLPRAPGFWGCGAGGEGADAAADAGAFSVADEEDAKRLVRSVCRDEPSLLRAASLSSLGRPGRAPAIMASDGTPLSDFADSWRRRASSIKQWTSVTRWSNDERGTASTMTMSEALDAASIAASGAERPLRQPRPTLEDEEVWRRYHSRLRTARCLDFDDLLGVAVGLLDARPDLAADARARHRHLLVDEFQDTNGLQYALLQRLSPLADPDGGASVVAESIERGRVPPSLFCVGDADQAVYGWRGADLSFLAQRFTRDFRATTTHRLVDCHRCAPAVARLSEGIANGPRLDGSSEKRGSAATRVRSVVAASPAIASSAAARILLVRGPREEMATVVALAAALADSARRDGSTAAVLTRTNRELTFLESGLLAAGVPYRVAGGLPFWGRAEVRDVLAFLRLVTNPRDAPAAERVVNRPPRGLGEKSLGALRDWGAGDLAAGLFPGWGEPGGPLDNPRLLAEAEAAVAAHSGHFGADADNADAVVAALSAWGQLDGESAAVAALGPLWDGGWGDRLSVGVDGQPPLPTKRAEAGVAALRRCLFCWRLWAQVVTVGGGGQDDHSGRSGSSLMSRAFVADAARAVVRDSGYAEALRDGALDAGLGKRETKDAARRLDNLDVVAAQLSAAAPAALVAAREAHRAAFASDDNNDDNDGGGGGQVALVAPPVSLLAVLCEAVRAAQLESDLSESAGVAAAAAVAATAASGADGTAAPVPSPPLALCTAHASKGLEFDRVLAPGVGEDGWPHPLSRAEGRGEEERRLLFVAVTRARLSVTFTASRWSPRAAAALDGDNQTNTAGGLSSSVAGPSPLLAGALADGSLVAVTWDGGAEGAAEAAGLVPAGTGRRSHPVMGSASASPPPGASSSVGPRAPVSPRAPPPVARGPGSRRGARLRGGPRS